MRRLEGKKLIGVVDTMFARVDMGGLVLAALAEKQGRGEVWDTIRRTVPGFKDLGVAAKQLIEDEGCHIVVACGMPGAADLDRACTHEASLGIIAAQMLTSIPVLEVFVHEVEGGGDDAALVAVCRDRCAGHARNAYDMLFAPETLVARAGMGVRQGQPDAGPILLPEPT
ncbi:MAG TPA: riboflavin synthase [Rhizomicrobium sp.]|jgi:riboflavin synthase|nr:riboflavin synthase [Rhizomicrobium sp.]